MSQRDSGYERKDFDAYETPEWVTKALVRHLAGPSQMGEVWEPACGSGKMAQVLRSEGYHVRATDIQCGVDFLQDHKDIIPNAVITNPPYELAEEFISQALRVARRYVAMLLRTDFDHAKTRQYLFGECSAFSKKIVLTKRIRWFEDSKGSPSFNHAWFIWDWKHQGPPTLAYGP